MDAKMSSLKEFGKAASTLIFLFKDILGIYIDPAKKKADAKAEMKIEKQKLIHQYDLKKIELIERAKLRIFETELRRQYNLELIGRDALQLLPEYATPEKINIDWLHHFAASSQDTGEDDLRKIWASILSQEATEPGKYSKRTLDYLKNFSVKDCRLFEKFRPFIFFTNYNEYGFIIKSKGEKAFLKEFNFLFEEFLHLISIGILASEKSLSIFIEANNSQKYKYYNKTINIINKTNESQVIPKIHALSEVGTQLATIVKMEENVGYLQDSIKFIESQNLQVEIS